MIVDCDPCSLQENEYQKKRYLQALWAENAKDFIDVTPRHLRYRQLKVRYQQNLKKTIYPFHPYRPVWYGPDQGKGYTIVDTYRVERVKTSAEIS